MICASSALVRANCHACGHKAVIPNAALAERRPGYTRLMSLERSCVAGLRRQGQGKSLLMPTGQSQMSDRGGAGTQLIGNQFRRRALLLGFLKSLRRSAA
jgi:hypothetical protein